MSIDSAKAYVERMKNDEEFRKKVLACKDPKTRMELVKSEGYDFTANDINVVKAVLDDEGLYNANGGDCSNAFDYLSGLIDYHCYK